MVARSTQIDKEDTIRALHVRDLKLMVMGIKKTIFRIWFSSRIDRVSGHSSVTRERGGDRQSVA